ncbi:hypothetical protein [Nitrosomonas sp. Nm33]|uniref:hypothetical protein n=1 Tax=Nitrosomonas sp. Nm33 TaxID=133724 RepID=UPI0008958781|nr:hypothetical protein [Nitrosomonas sp. Nm33]SDY39983.1 hypothetical protein SAMN05421755_102030 [Nitrosomonas sp. Nm33]
MGKGILQIFWEKMQEALGGQKASSEATPPQAISPQTTPPKTTLPQATSPEVEEVSKVPKVSAIPVNLAEQLRAKIAQNAAFLYVFETGEASTTPDGMICSSHVGTNGEAGYITLAKGNPKAGSGGVTGGYSIRLPDQIEAAASGHHIAVSVIARASGGDQSRFAVAYSTNEVGNSGWRKFTAGAEWAVYTMEFDVNVMKEGRGDFVGILPDSEGSPATDFCYFAITIS